MRIVNAFDPESSLNTEKNYELYLEGNSQMLQLAVYDSSQNVFVGVKQYFAESGEETDTVTALFNNQSELISS